MEPTPRNVVTVGHGDLVVHRGVQYTIDWHTGYREDGKITIYVLGGQSFCATKCDAVFKREEVPTEEAPAVDASPKPVRKRRRK